MTLEKLPLEGYKVHQGEGDQLSYKGMALTPAVQAIAIKVNEIVEYINKVERMFGMDGIDSPPEATRDLYKEDQVKGNEI